MGNLAGAIASVMQKKAKYVIGWVASVILGISVQWLEANNFKNLIFDDYMPGWSNDRTNEGPVFRSRDHSGPIRGQYPE